MLTNNDILKSLMEDYQFIDIMNADIIQEGLFGKKAYRVSDNNTNQGYLNANMHVYNSPKMALRSEIGSRCHGKLKEWKQYQSNINEYDTDIIINEKYEKLLDTIVYLYTCEIYDNFENNESKYGKSIRKNSKIISVEKNTLRNFIRKYNIGIIIEKNSGNTNERQKLLTIARRILEDGLKKLKSKYPLKDSIYISRTNDEYYIEEKDNFIDGSGNRISIAYYDLWKFTDDARDRDETQNFWKYFKELEYGVNRELSRYGAKITAENGDWDTGPLDLVVR